MDSSEKAGALLFAGGAQFVIGLTIAEALHPGYSIPHDSISSLGLGPASLVFNASAVLLGALIIAGALALFLSSHRLLPTIPLLLAGIGAVGVGVIPETSGLPHGLVAGLAFFSGGLSALTSFILTERLFRFISVLMGVFALAAMVLFATGNFLGLGYGGMERLILLPVLIWVVGFGCYLAKHGEQRGQASR